MPPEALNTFLIGISIVAILIGISVVLERFWTNELLVMITFEGAGFLLFMILFAAFFLTVFDFETPTQDEFRMGMISFFHMKLSEIGYARIFAAFNFCLAGGVGFLWVLSPLVPSVIDRQAHAGAFFIFVTIGLVTLVGLFVFFEGVALILGIVATVIGILLGIKKLSSQ